MERITEAGAVFETDHRGCSAMKHHRHGSSFVTLVLGGAYVEVCDMVPALCRSGSIVVHDAAEEHADRFASDTRCLNVELPCDSGATGSRGSIALDLAPLQNAVGEVVRSFYGDGRELGAAVVRLHDALLRRSTEAPPKRPTWLRSVIDGFPWEEAVPLREAAAIAGLHETHFSRAFRRHVGMTANAYRTRARIRLASKMLLTTMAPIARIALNAGFSDQSHLTRAFSRSLGLSPAGFRRTFAR
jgi:AraC-like DNA-binding protein